MLRSRILQASLVGSLAALASFCALRAHGGETYSIVAQSNRGSAATGRRPLAERIAAANLPIIVQTSGSGPVVPVSEPPAQENVAVAAVAVDEPAAPASAEPIDPPQPHGGKHRSPQATARAFWKTMTGSLPATLTR